MSFETKLAELKARFREVADLNAANAVLHWDQSTYMPPGGAEARGRQVATLSRLAHEIFAARETGRLLDALEREAEGLEPGSDDAALLRVARRDYDRAVRVPGAFLQEANEHAARAYHAWVAARPADDVAAVLPLLERTLELSRRYAGFFPEAAHPADALIEESDPGATVAELRPMFARLRDALRPMVEAIAQRQDPGDAPLRGSFDREAQLAFGLRVARAYGYDLERGRQDETHHPFATSFGVGDVRITTRVRTDDLSEALFSTLHEAGHAMYEQGIDPAFDGTPLAGGVSSGVHESQSRLWENLVGRDRAFWERWYPDLRAAFPGALDDVPLDGFHRSVNRVRPSLIRTDADELTYNLHVIIRFDLECALLEGALDIADLPDAWDARYESDLGVRAAEPRNGVLQDVHWFGGLIGGAFQGYALGNILSAQFYESALAARPGIPAEGARGEYGSLHGWLRENVYRWGRRYEPDELVRRATGRPMELEPYLRYLRGKYGELYDVDLETAGHA